MSAIAIKRLPKKDREHQVLLGLIHHYLKTGKPVGSHTLKEEGFEHLSAATIRNYFVNLENEGYLTQQHISGGRTPTPKAYRLYAQEYAESPSISKEHHALLQDLRTCESKEITTFLQQAAEKLSQLAGMAVVLSAPRFDQDYVIGLKLVGIDHSRCLCVIITDFGVIHTEVIPLDQKLSTLSIKRIEAYFYWRLTGRDKPENLDKEDEELAQRIYNELMVRYLVRYSNFIDSEVYRTGFSRLLHYPEFCDAEALANGLALFENVHNLRLLVKECCKHNKLKFWIGDDLGAYVPSVPNCAVIAIPYYINNHVVGAVALLGPMRVPYQEVFSMMRCFSENISEAITKHLYKYKITFRQPLADHALLSPTKQQQLLEHSRLLLLEEIPKINNYKE